MAFLTSRQAVVGNLPVTLRWIGAQPDRVDLIVNGYTVGSVDRHIAAKYLANGDHDVVQWLGLEGRGYES